MVWRSCTADSHARRRLPMAACLCKICKRVIFQFFVFIQCFKYLWCWGFQIWVKVFLNLQPCSTCLSFKVSTWEGSNILSISAWSFFWSLRSCRISRNICCRLRRLVSIPKITSEYAKIKYKLQTCFEISWSYHVIIRGGFRSWPKRSQNILFY